MADIGHTNKYGEFQAGREVPINPPKVKNLDEVMDYLDLRFDTNEAMLRQVIRYQSRSTWRRIIDWFGGWIR